MRYFLALFLLIHNFILGMDVVLYYSHKCPHSQKVLAYMRQNDINIPLKNAAENETYRDELEKNGGYAIVPCLFVDMKPIYNDYDIIDWLSEHKNALTKSQ